MTCNCSPTVACGGAYTYLQPLFNALYLTSFCIDQCLPSYAAEHTPDIMRKRKAPGLVIPYGSPFKLSASYQGFPARSNPDMEDPCTRTTFYTLMETEYGFRLVQPSIENWGCSPGDRVQGWFTFGYW